MSVWTVHPSEPAQNGAWGSPGRAIRRKPDHPSFRTRTTRCVGNICSALHLESDHPSTRTRTMWCPGSAIYPEPVHPSIRTYKARSAGSQSALNQTVRQARTLTTRCEGHCHSPQTGPSIMTEPTWHGTQAVPSAPNWTVHSPKPKRHGVLAFLSHPPKIRPCVRENPHSTVRGAVLAMPTT